MSEEIKQKRVSYSQFSNWILCSHRWYLDHPKGLRVFEDNISTCFGTSIHEVIQLYIKTLYTTGVTDADSHNLNDIFIKTFDKEIIDKKVIITDKQKQDYIQDGKNIIIAFCNPINRIKYFPSNKYEFIGIEDEIVMPIKNNVEFICYIDVILKEKTTGRYRIIDIKTSSMGWNEYQKQNKFKTAQVLLYKSFFSKKYNVPLDKIDVEFFILKRKLYENFSFPQSRIQLLKPKDKNKDIIEVLKWFTEFVSSCFLPSGEFNTDEKNYPRVPGEKNKHCKYCPHRRINCDGKSDLTEEEMS